MGRDGRVGIRVRGNTLTTFVVGNKRELERLNVYYTNPHDYRLNTGPFYQKCGKKNKGLVHRKTHCVIVHLIQVPPSYRLPHGTEFKRFNHSKL